MPKNIRQAMSDEEGRVEQAIWQAIERGLTCDITTTGTPGRRDWLANLQANPRMIFHVKQGVHADLPAHGLVIDDLTERRRVMGAVMRGNSWFRAQPYDLDAWVAGSPLVEVVLDGR